MSSASLPKNYRKVLTFANLEGFFDLVYDRIHERLETYFKYRYTFFLNAMIRMDPDVPVGEQYKYLRYSDFPFRYYGVDRQLEFLKYNAQSIPTQVEDAFNDLKLIEELQTTDVAEVTSKMQDDFEKFEIEMCRFGSLKDYFKSTTEERQTRVGQPQEYAILSHFFNLEEYFYFSVPLIEFGEYDGVVHIVCHEQDHAIFFEPSQPEKINKKIVGDIIKAISREYEGAILDTDIGDSNYIREEEIMKVFDKNNKEVQDIFKNNPLLQELKFYEYYQTHRWYFEKRLAQLRDIPSPLKAIYRQKASMAILMDSYTHNISAHSLVAQESFFHQRAIKYGGLLGELYGDKVNGYELPIIQRREGFDLEIHKMLSFLLDKGAFWTGLTRDYNFGGETISFFDLIWNHFVNNPLYLGTIAFTENILKLSIRITVLRQLPIEQEGVLYKKQIILDRDLARIDLTQYDESEELKEKGVSGFVKTTECFEQIKEKLENYQVFLPGGVVGRHCFLTLLENEIRNIKHFKHLDLENIKKDGLVLNISLEEAFINEDLRKKGGSAQAFAIGIWLRHPTSVDTELIEGKRLRRLYEDIIEETNQPRLGGTYQDKVCAAFLLNNDFKSVQQEEYEREERHKAYYPWVKAGFCEVSSAKEGDVIEDWIFSARRILIKPHRVEESTLDFFKKSRKIFEKKFETPQRGYYKKILHLWKGEEILTYDDKFRSIHKPGWENFSRYKFAFVPPNIEDNNKGVKSKAPGRSDLIRIINKPARNLEDAYKLWLKIWLKDSQREEFSYAFSQQRAILSELYWNGKNISFLSMEMGKDNFSKIAESNKFELIHGNDSDEPIETNKLRYRNHLTLRRHYFNDDTNGQFQNGLKVKLAYELFETLATKICIFDNRVSKWAKAITDEKMRKLGCVFREEKLEEWNKERELNNNGFLDYHFLVVHLSFIENGFRDEQDKTRYSEDNLHEFIENEIFKRTSNEELPKNFILVITSGRARMKWFNSLDEKNEIKSLVTFRPVESLIRVTQQALADRDDFELKHALTKILLCS